MDMDNLAILEEKINLLLTTTKRLRQQLAQVTQDKQELQQQLEEQKSVSAEVSELKEQLGKLEEENKILLEERNTVKTRIENLITELDSIDLSESANELFIEKQ